MVLLLWAWADSGRHHSSWKRPAGRNVYLSLSCIDSRIEFERSVATVDESKVEPYRYIYPSGPLGWVAREEISARFRMRSFPGFERIDSVQQSADLVIRCYGFAIPFWFLLAAYLPLWLAVSYWHSRRKQKRLQQSLPSSAQPQQ